MARAYGVGQRYISSAVHILGLASLALVLVWSLHFRGGVAWMAHVKQRIFNLHPPLMLMFLFLFSEAILVFRMLPSTSSKELRKGIHLGVQLPALLLAILGIWAAFRYHNESSPPIDNLYSLHAWLGLGAVILFALQWIAGFLAFWFPGVSVGVRVRALPWHVIIGLLIYAMAIAAALTGILERLTFLQVARLVKHFSSEAMLANTLGVVLFFLGGSVVLAVLLPNEGEEDLSNNVKSQWR